MRTILRAALFVRLGGASGAFAQTIPIPIPLSVSGNEARGTIALPGDIGAELTIAFDSVDVWRANDPSHVNVAGELRSGADTLKFSLHRKANR